ncbi:hypothetical protein, partial [Azorhizobium caulinodans]
GAKARPAISARTSEESADVLEIRMAIPPTDAFYSNTLAFSGFRTSKIGRFDAPCRPAPLAFSSRLL